MISALAGWPTRHRAAAFSILLLLTLVGTVLAPWLALERLPAASGTTLVVEARLPGIDALQVERLVVTPIEEALSTLPRLRETLTRASDGRAVIQLGFSSTDGREFALGVARERMAALTPALPAGMDAPVVERGDAPPRAAAEYAITAEALSGDVLRWAERELRRPLHELAETSSATLDGADTTELLIEPDARRLVTLGLSLDDVILALRRDDVAPALRSARRMATTAPASAEAIAVRAVRLPSGEPIALAEVAQVSITQRAAAEHPLYRGRPALLLRVTPRSAAEAVDVARRVDAHQAWLRANGLVPPDVALHKIFDEAEETQKWFRRVLKRVGTALAVSLVAVAVFLGIRAAAVTLGAFVVWIPLSAGALGLAGMSLNVMTLAGLMFAGAALVLVTVRLAVAPMVAAMAVVAGMASWWNDGLFGLPPPVLSGFAVATLLALLVAWLMSAWSGEIPASAAYRGGRSPVPRQWHTLRVSALALFLIVAVSVGVKNLPVAVAPTAGGTVVLRISGDDEARVMVAADELHERLRALPGLSGVARTPVREQRWQLRLDDARMQESGVDIVSVGRAFDIARNGLVVGELNDADAQLPLRVQLAPGASGTAFERLLLRGERRDQHAIYLRDVGIAERVHSGREHIRWQRQPAAEIRARWRGAQVPPAIATLRASELPAGMVLQIEATTTAADVGGAR